MKLKITTILCSLFFFCQSESSFAQSTAKTAYEQVKEGKAVFIDVREKDELQSGWVDKALWLPMSHTDKTGWVENLKKLSKDKKIYLYCRSGARAGSLQGYLARHGLKVENLGGFAHLKAMDIPSQTTDPKCSLAESICM
jgi:rhodanese-related sulfurtransferase